jgi:bacterioferritin-associated ferredoxin
MSKVTKCVCFDITFRELKQLSIKNNCKSLQELKEYVIFSEKCKLCTLYIQKMFETDQVEFDVMS